MIPNPLRNRVLLTLALLAGLGARGVHAQAALPDVLPGGYVMEAENQVRWIYPGSAEDEVAALKEALPSTLAMLGKALGVRSGPPLDVRVALHADEMVQLVPGRRLPDYATGVAYPEEGLILMALAEPFTFGRPDMHKLFVHELTHVMLHRAVDGQPIPRWFTEGAAIQLADEHSIDRVRVLWEATMRRQLQPIRTLSAGFPRDHHRVSVAYAQSADLLGHMLDGADEQGRFRDLIRELRAGQPFAAAVRTAYGVSLGYLEREWRGSLMRRFGRWPSLLSGLTVVWALAAMLLLVGYVRTRRRQRRTLARWSEEEARESGNLAHEAPPATPPTFSIAVTDATPKVHRLDEFMDRFQQRATTAEPDVPTIEHEGRNHTLH